MTQGKIDDDDTVTYRVVANDEEQYSIWPANREFARGWRDVGKIGTREECLTYINEVWTDMRPLSLRNQMADEARRRLEGSLPSDTRPAAAPPSSLVERLSLGRHSVVASRLSETNARAFKNRIDAGYVHLKFTDTSGETELGVRLDPDSLDLSHANFDHQTGWVHLEGALTLDYVKVKLVADVDLSTLAGKGQLVALPS